MTVSKTLIMVFAKAPVAGQVKTRLIPALGQKVTTEFYKRLVHHTLKMVSQLEGVTIQLYCTPDTEVDFFTQCAATFSLSLKKQKGSDLGMRMQHAFQTGLQQYQQVICIGCDCPELIAEDIANAIESLENGYDACISPAYDGGYVLLGLKRFSPLLFEKINWGTAEVMQQTRKQLVAANYNFSRLAFHHDIDAPADLIYCPSDLLGGLVRQF